jgi:hypothetical protein
MSDGRINFPDPKTNKQLLASKVAVERLLQVGHGPGMTLVLDLPDSWESLLGLNSGDAAQRAREMLVLEGYREGRLSRGQVSEMLGLGFHETEVFLAEHHAEQQPTWLELEAGTSQLRSRISE